MADSGSNIPSQDGVDMAMLDILTNMGFGENICRRALIHTSNQSPDIALNWILEHNEDPEMNMPVPKDYAMTLRSHPSDLDALYERAFSQLGEVATVSHKMVLVVRRDLNMSVGKIAAQCSHAAVAMFKRLMVGNPNLLSEWEHEGQKKVVVECRDEAELNELEIRAVSISVPCQIIRDAGRTEVEAGSKTVLAVLGPDYLVDQVTGSLKLLK